MPEPFREVLLAYYDTLERYRLLTYGQQIVRAVRELERAEVRAKVHADLRHLIVDEYQDVNPAQERLIELLAGPKVELCVVGDDDQAIYQWRGSDVANIVTFATRYPKVATFAITTNRRSRPQVIDAANRFAATIPGRLPKEMAQNRPSSGGAEVVVWTAPDEQREAGWVTNLALDLHDAGVPFGTSPCSSAVGPPTASWSTSSRRSTSPCSRAGGPACSTSPRPRSSGGPSPG